MGMGVTIHGVIEAPMVTQDELCIYRHNRAAIRALPQKDPQTFIRRAMFTVPPHGPGPPYRAGQGVLAPHYEHLPIHFAANYKEMLLLPASWVREFEQLLSKLFWSNAVVYSEFTGIRYRWQPVREFRYDPTHPGKFTLTCCGFKEVNLTNAQAIAGDYVPVSSPHNV